MAQVSQAEQPPAAEDGWLSTKIDHYLDYELRAWRSVPEYAARWPEMEALDQETFHLHWKGVTEGYLRELEGYASEHRLSAQQLARYGQLRALIARHRLTLEALLGEEPAPSRAG